MSHGRGDPLFPDLSENERVLFPDPNLANGEGVLCRGGNLSPGVILSAYSQGIFPWFSEDDPLLWWSPDPRFVLFPEELHVSASMRKVLRRGGFSLSLDRDFAGVMEACAASPRRGQTGTWITSDMIEAYERLHALGYAHSVETRLNGELVGGLYGVSIGRLFCGESMFSRVPNASKAALIAITWKLKDEGFPVIDSQVYTDHMASLGAREIPRGEYLSLVRQAIDRPSPEGDWSKLFPDFPLSKEWLGSIKRPSGPDTKERV